jgi:hypothetical protein
LVPSHSARLNKGEGSIAYPAFRNNLRTNGLADAMANEAEENLVLTPFTQMALDFLSARKAKRMRFFQPACPRATFSIISFLSLAENGLSAVLFACAEPMAMVTRA